MLFRSYYHKNIKKTSVDLNFLYFFNIYFPIISSTDGALAALRIAQHADLHEVRGRQHDVGELDGGAVPQLPTRIKVERLEGLLSKSDCLALRYMRFTS